MSLLNKIHRELQPGAASAKADARIPAGLGQINKTILIGVCLAITLVLLIFLKDPGRSSAPEKSPAPVESIAVAPERPQAAVAPQPAPLSVPPAATVGREMPKTSEPQASPQYEAAPLVRVGNVRVPVTTAATVPRQEVEPPAGGEVNNALTEEEARYVPVRSFASAEQAYLAGKRALITESSSDLAVKYLRQALALDTRHLLARELLAEIYHKVAQRPKEAMALLQEGLAIAPDHQEFSKKYALILGERGDHATAAAVLLRSGLPSLKNDREALELLASLYLELDEPYLAAQTYRSLLSRWPRDGDYWFLLGVALETQKQIGAAVDCYQKALATHTLGRERADTAAQKIEQLAQSSPGVAK